MQTLQRAELLHNCEEEEAWLREQGQLVEDAALGPDLSQIAAALQQHKVPTTLRPAGSPLPAFPPFPSPSSLLCCLPGPRSRAPPATRPCALISFGEDATWAHAGPDRGGSPGTGRGGAGRVAEALGPGGGAGRGARLQAALLVQQVAGRRVGSVGSARAQPALLSTSPTWRRQPCGSGSGGQRRRACPLGRTRRPLRPCCGATCGSSAAVRVFGAELRRLDEPAPAAARGHRRSWYAGDPPGRDPDPRASDNKCACCARSPMVTQRVEMGGHLWPLTRPSPALGGAHPSSDHLPCRPAHS